MVQQYLRCNYRQTGGLADIDAFQSMIVRYRATVQINSTDTGLTFSTNGYGRPAWAMVIPVSHVLTYIDIIHLSLDSAGSIIFASFFGFDYSGTSAGIGAANSLAATVSYPFEVIALIASR